MTAAVSRSTRRRAAFAVALVAAVVIVFIVRLVSIQIVQADTLNAASLDKLSMQNPIYGLRGDIVDNDGTVLATTVLRYDVTASPRSVTDFERTGEDGKTVDVTPTQAAAEIAAITGQTPEAVYGALTADPSSNFAYVTQGIDVDAFRAIRDLGIPWLYYESNPVRTYPNGAVGGSVVGFTGAPGENGLEGLAGVEQLDNECLVGTDGLETYERGADGVAIPGTTETAVEAKPGGTAVLTIDSDLQFFAQQTLLDRITEVGAEWGTVVVSEVKTGKLLAVADYPSVDPNNVDATAEADRGSKAFQAPFEPGSTFKALTAASVLDAGLATTQTQVVAPYIYTDANGASTRDSSFHADPLNLTFAGVMQESSNTGTAMLGELLSSEQRYGYIEKFHMTTPSEVGFPAESGGILAPWDEWDDQTNLTTTFGQGVSTTAVQIASLYQTLGNHGVRLPVQLVEGCRQADGTMTDTVEPTGEQIVPDAVATDVVNMLETVVTGGYAKSSLEIPGYRVAAKTGTAQMSDGSGAYSSSYITSVAGLAPAEDPQYVVSVSIAKPVTIDSALAAAPVFQKIMSQVLKQNRVLPSTVPAPEMPTTF
ncbi:penicillin-binding protein 2 [Herbiconiux sp. CPCC 203407]|uniref:Penicillin-binding protein 2 n=1 Tax=Herbiconiux oxytropis TaxID=2970915 RepID=A0AA41XJB8_9MICO|nr:penicillin-binding protein 2 [Herbiconiux oxytropis]MCS5722809.1 penicillin-binding protein 2 [Herbiconiux oxytropis]MCS5727739.1 penicillin-binding protein 2 [Herbiconiux oxytropis]